MSLNDALLRHFSHFLKTDKSNASWNGGWSRIDGFASLSLIPLFSVISAILAKLIFLMPAGLDAEAEMLVLLLLAVLSVF